MHAERLIALCSLKEIADGECFWAKLGSNEALALKLKQTQDSEKTWAIHLSPEKPVARNFGGWGLTIVGASITPAIEQPNHFAIDGDSKAGDLCLHRSNKLSLCFGEERSDSLWHAYVESGEEADRAADPVLARVLKWRIVQRQFDDHQTVFTRKPTEN
jgi:hypothetical protein